MRVARKLIIEGRRNTNIIMLYATAPCLCLAVKNAYENKITGIATINNHPRLASILGSVDLFMIMVSIVTFFSEGAVARVNMRLIRQHDVRIGPSWIS